jgi:uncharacterized protein with GYD domain
MAFRLLTLVILQIAKLIIFFNLAKKTLKKCKQPPLRLKNANESLKKVALWRFVFMGD